MKQRIVFTFLLIAICGVTASAQENLFGVGWAINFPNNNDYLTKTSFSGGRVEYRHKFKSKFSIGGAFDWATYEQHIPRTTIQKPDGNGAITSDYIAQATQIPITLTGHYYFKGGNLLEPYAGIALGAQYLQQSLYYNVYVSDEYSWGFVARPEVGTIIKLSDSFGLTASAHYSFATNTLDLLDRSSFNNFGFVIGIMLRQ